ncbi:MAG: hypothetical protein PIR02_17595 [Microbacterium enclense]
MLATLLDAAEAEGRRTPTPADIRHAALNGTAARLDRRFALVTAVAAVVAAVIAGLLFFQATPGPAMLLLLSGVTPLFSSWSAIATGRFRGVIGDVRAVALLATSGLAWVLGALTALSWMLGFDDADAGRPPQGLAGAFLPLFGAGIAVGATAISLAVDAMLRRRTRLPWAARLLIAAVAGLAVAPLVGLSTMTPTAAALLAGGAIVLAVLPERRAAGVVPSPGRARSDGNPGRAVPDARRRTVTAASAWLALSGGVVGLAYAFSGAAWSPGATDGTIAMAHGITLLLVSVLPLLAAVGVAKPLPPLPRAGLHRWGPLALAALSTCCVAAAYIEAPDSSAMQPGLQAGAVLVGGGLAWAIGAHARLPRGAAVVVGIACGALYASFAGVMIAPMLAFAVPVVALILALRARRPRPRAGRVPVRPDGVPAPAR